MNHSRYRLILVLLILVGRFSVFARGAQDAGEDASLSVTDYYNRTVALDRPVSSIVSLAPAVTETAFALGYGDRVIGRTEWCDYPPEATSIPMVGSLMMPDIEAIVGLSPDLVVASSHFPEEAMERLESAGLNVVVFLGPESLEGTYDGVIRPMATIFGDEEAGERLVNHMEDQIAQAMIKIPTDRAKPRVYYVVGFGEGGDWTATGETFIHELLVSAGGENVAEEARDWSFSLEALVEADPDIIIIPSWAESVFPETPIYADLRAVQEGRLYAIDENLLVRQGPRLSDGFARLVDLLHSEN